MGWAHVGIADWWHVSEAFRQWTARLVAGCPNGPWPMWPFVEVREDRRLDSPRGFLYNGKPLSPYLAEISVATSQCKF